MASYEIWQTHPLVTPAVTELTWPTLRVEFMRHPHYGIAVEAYCTLCHSCFRSSDGQGGQGPVCYISEHLMELTEPDSIEESKHGFDAVKAIAQMIAHRVNRVPCACALGHRAAMAMGEATTP